MKFNRAILFLPVLLLLGFATAAASTNTDDGKHNSDTDVQRMTVEELKAMLARDENVVIIDVRGKDYDASPTRIKGAMRIVPAEMASHLNSIPRDKEIVTYCACSTDGGAVAAARVLLDNGFKRVRALKGGWKAWVQAGGAVESK
ncbi:MAG TPA: rhodanese-like domain-containing protein [Blastocatellia bacterium]|nr:rhodanese-like domain-containing protein [Blastocatellia bacterium]